MTAWDIRQMQSLVTAHLTELAPLFQPHMRLTFVARDPANPECVVVVTDDDMAGLADALAARAKRKEN